MLARVTRQSLDSIARGEDDAGQMEDRLALSLTRDLLAVRAVLSR